MTSLRKGTIKNIVPNLRQRWTEELKPYTDDAIAEVYENFALSDEAGDNDARFPEWFDMLDNDYVADRSSN